LPFFAPAYSGGFFLVPTGLSSNLSSNHLIKLSASLNL
jgi:hypothetical protein